MQLLCGRRLSPTYIRSQISNLIATEILKWDDVNLRVGVLEKWVAVADICRCLHNYNAVLEITSSLNRSSIFRLKKTWLKVSKQVSSPHYYRWHEAEQVPPIMTIGTKQVNCPDYHY